MSYPEPTYQGDGEVSATVRRAAATPELFNSTGSCSYLATGASTNGHYGLYRWDMGPEPSGPGPHFHRSISESFFVLSGTVRIYDGKEWVETGAGDFAFVPEGGVHGFRNESGADASMLILFAPGAPREGYFEGLVEFGRRAEKPSQEEWDEFMRYHDTYWV
jgi:mannose-6-phosphate isomerase-like protein (cupin superfamily)